MRFAHMGDCHLGGWRHPELATLTMQSFASAVNTSIKEKVDFVLIAGDLFDTAYPPIDTIKDAFEQFRKLKDANIPVFLIAGSHDYSASGKTFLEVLEKAGFAKNAHQPEERNGSIILSPILYNGAAIYGYPGKKSGMEVEEISRIKLQEAPGFFKILMLHTAIRDAVGTLPISAVDQDNLPKVDYLALAHLHIDYNKNSRVYCGPTFPNNSNELEELQGGSFYIVDTKGKPKKISIKLKDVLIVEKKITNAFTATEDILVSLKDKDLKDKIIILKISGVLESGKKTDIKFNEIEKFVRDSGAYVFLKSTTKLYADEPEFNFTVNPDSIEEDIIKKFQEEHESSFNTHVGQLFHALNVDKKEGEVSRIFESRVFEEFSKVFSIK